MYEYFNAQNEPIASVSGGMVAWLPHKNQEQLKDRALAGLFKVALAVNSSRFSQVAADSIETVAIHGVRVDITDLNAHITSNNATVAGEHPITDGPRARKTNKAPVTYYNLTEDHPKVNSDRELLQRVFPRIFPEPSH